MPTLSTPARNAGVNGVVDLIDGGSGAGYLRIYDSGDVLLASLPMSDPAFGAASSGTATANTITADTSADATGTASYFTCEDSASTEVFRGTVGTSGTELVLNTVSITAGDNVSVTALTVTQPAS